MPDRTLKTQRRLVAVVVTHNRLDKLRPTIDRLLESASDQLSAIVIVDNASTDATADWLATLTNPRLDIVTNTINLGGAGGFEAGMRHAVARHDPDWLVVMDDDARPLPGALAAFHALPPEKWDAIAAAVYFPDGRICEMNRPSRNPFWSLRLVLRTLREGRNGFHIPHDEYDKDGCEIDVTSFVGFFISRRALEMAGFPDGRLFLYGDDGLYTLGLSRAGGRIAFQPQVAFEHDFTTFGGSGAATGQRFSPLWKIYYHHRNLLLLYRMAAGPLFWPALLIVLPKWFSKVRHHAGSRRAFLRLMGRAVFDGLFNRLDVSHEAIKRLAGPEPST
ncbi:glycosyltransferase [Roseovarius sp. HI0049]|nr:glycosyltransferase [Roseovarius sp. HI0049]